MPIARAKKEQGHATFDDWTADWIEATGAGNLFVVLRRVGHRGDDGKDGQMVVAIRGVESTTRRPVESAPAAPTTSPVYSSVINVSVKSPSPRMDGHKH